MPAYSFKERFVPWVMDGSKPGTIRAFRKYPVKVGQLAHLFYGMRTKFCKKLVEPSPVIGTVVSIYVGACKDVAIINTPWIDETTCEAVCRFTKQKQINELFKGKVKWLTAEECDELAWQDGFRMKSTREDVAQIRAYSFDAMIDFWQKTHELPFLGNYILWGDSNVKLV